MITIKELRWSNTFSYGQDNKINFINAPLTQLVGKNGHGKSSIALILEEVLFNKNSKGIKKADILNRYVKDKNYQIELDFDKDGTEYTIRTQRGTTQTVKLIKNGADISGHTATSTYKMIEDILGFDHKSFSQIVYQSHASSLEFLTAADTARKKFLIEILNLGKYTKAQEVFKEVSQELNESIATTKAKVTTVKSWLDKYSTADLSLQEFKPVPPLDEYLVARSSNLEQSLLGIEQTNKKIQQNNTYKQVQSKLVLVPIPAKPKEQEDAYVKQQIEAAKEYSTAKAFVDKMSKLHGTCPTCLSQIDGARVGKIVAEHQDLMQDAEQRERVASAKVKQLKQELKLWQDAQKSQEEWEKYHNLIDTSLPDKLLDKEALQGELETIKLVISEAKEQIKRAETHNRSVSAHNSKVELIKNQLVEMEQELEQHSVRLHELSERMNIINILNKTFSTTGLVAYKIECLVKDLEEITNQYLVDLSDGRFQISFRVNASDKLNVIITDNGKDIEMLALSGGERARVNAATLLAIRKLMQTLSSSRINLLILDETVEALDLDGKEKLVEVLLREEHLNTFLVSHGFTHPLLEKVNVVKRNNISKIEV